MSKHVPADAPQDRNAGLRPARPAGVSPAGLDHGRRDARRPHRRGRLRSVPAPLAAAAAPPAAPCQLLPGLRDFVPFGFALLLVVLASPAKAGGNPEWVSPFPFRVLLSVEAGTRQRSNSPARVEIDFQSLVGNGRALAPETIEVVGYTEVGQARVIDASKDGAEQYRVPHRLDPFFGMTKVALHFMVPDHHCTRFAVYFDIVPSAPRRLRYHGLVGDGDVFAERFQRREIAASHFDQFVDFDGDGDLDLFKGGVEPFVYCYENVGGNRLVDRGRLTSDGKLFVLPKSRANRSWVTVVFDDVDGDGDQDFCPSFGDGPDSGLIVFYRNTTREHGGQLTFTRVGPMQTVSGIPLAGGGQAGGWFPSLCFVNGWPGASSPSALVGSNHRCWLYRSLGANADGSPRFADAVPVQAGGVDIVLTNPRFDAADIDGDGDIDLFAGTQPGPVHLFTNTGTAEKPEFAAGTVIAFGGKYLIGDAHSGVTAADFNRDGLVDFVAGRFWERTDLNQPDEPRDYGGFFQNTGSRSAPVFERTTIGSPFTERVQPCDAIRQNSVRALDWDGDSRTDLLAGDTDGFIWLFRNKSDHRFPVLAPGVKLLAEGRPLSVAESGGHARLDTSDWNNDGIRDLLVADGGGTLTLFLGTGSSQSPALAAGTKLHAGDKPIQVGGRASVLACDWDADSRKDLVLADDKGFYFCRNTGTEAAPLLAPPNPITFGGKKVSYVRPNLGSFVDWDGDGRKDLIAGHFENSIRFYRNIGSGAVGALPELADPEGVVIVQASSPQMISGAEAVDWNGDGDLDILTGQGHGGSGLRFYERDWIEDELHATHPLVKIGKIESKAADLQPEPTAFVDVTKESGIGKAMAKHYLDHPKWWLSGLNLVDLDADGHLDLFLAAHGAGAPLAMLNDGRGHFSEAAGSYPQTEIHLGCDINEDGRLDLQMTWQDGGGKWWLNESTPGRLGFRETGMTAGQGRANAMIDLNRDGRVDWLHERPGVAFEFGDGRGRFHPGGTLDVARTRNEINIHPVDLNGDGFIDLALHWGRYDYERGRSRLYLNDGKMNFGDTTQRAGLSEDGLVIKGLGDVNHDGHSDILMLEDKKPEILLNDGTGRFQKVPDAITGMETATKPAYCSWGLAVVTDFDNDGAADILWNGRHFLWVLRGTGDGHFAYMNKTWGIEDKSAASVDDGLCFGDIDAEGDLDIIGYSGSLDEQRQTKVYRNDVARQNWIRIRPVGAAGNRGAAGAKIRLTDPGNPEQLLWSEQVMILNSQSAHSYYGTGQTERHFGLGRRDSVDVSVEFYPSGRLITRKNVEANSTLIVPEE